MTQRNPFTPAFGTVPVVVAGREDVFDSMRTAFEDGPGNPNLSTILVGARGSGKTVCMTCMCDDALERGWIVVRTSAKNGMLQDIYEQTIRVAKEHIDGDSRHITSLGLGPVSAGWSEANPVEGNWRTRMSDVLDQLAQRDIGLVITVDEVRATVPEMIELAAVFQLFVVECRKVALVMAGLPYHVHRLLNDESVSFLRRSMQYQLGRIADADVRYALKATFEGAGKAISDEALDACVAACEGFAYMIQLVGYRTWAEARDVDAGIEHARRGIDAARNDMEEHIYRSTYRELSDGDMAFLDAMLADSVESRLADVARRMGVKSNYASRYKSRLLAQGVIGERGRSTVFAFDIPGFREFYTRERFAS